MVKNPSSRDRLVVRTLRCGRSNPGSNPGHGMDKIFFSEASDMKIMVLTKHASAGNRTRINCLEGSYADHYTTDAYTIIEYAIIWILIPKNVSI